MDLKKLARIADSTSDNWVENAVKDLTGSKAWVDVPKQVTKEQVEEVIEKVQKKLGSSEPYSSVSYDPKTRKIKIEEHLQDSAEVTVTWTDEEGEHSEGFTDHGAAEDFADNIRSRGGQAAETLKISDSAALTLDPLLELGCSQHDVLAELAQYWSRDKNDDFSEHLSAVYDIAESLDDDFLTYAESMELPLDGVWTEVNNYMSTKEVEEFSEHFKSICDSAKSIKKMAGRKIKDALEAEHVTLKDVPAKIEAGDTKFIVDEKGFSFLVEKEDDICYLSALTEEGEPEMIGMYEPENLVKEIEEHIHYVQEEEERWNAEKVSLDDAQARAESGALQFIVDLGERIYRVEKEHDFYHVIRYDKDHNYDMGEDWVQADEVREAIKSLEDEAAKEIQEREDIKANGKFENKVWNEGKALEIDLVDCPPGEGKGRNEFHIELQPRKDNQWYCTYVYIACNSKWAEENFPHATFAEYTAYPDEQVQEFLKEVKAYKKAW